MTASTKRPAQNKAPLCQGCGQELSPIHPWAAVVYDADDKPQHFAPFCESCWYTTVARRPQPTPRCLACNSSLPKHQPHAIAMPTPDGQYAHFLPFCMDCFVPTNSMDVHPPTGRKHPQPKHTRRP